ncbi:uncharacterized protein C8Q71DRAFT_855057 [Rhodofomes roseus]|uniref:Uncharacterized protein n=1 Tax=Rhodofomes roseus TaxID=34475 RepID=A0ABQ8KNL1_9APHY|nr:uncharacterized protein C8Q71DRAFT_855057 [Rhodofomes roseus]KAH9839740.1 hypothetical protein C8Q71DRAFT_855057 [Rhodofomes roseus]
MHPNSLVRRSASPALAPTSSLQKSPKAQTAHAETMQTDANPGNAQGGQTSSIAPENTPRPSPGRPGSPSFAEVAANAAKKDAAKKKEAAKKAASTRMQDIVQALATPGDQVATSESTNVTEPPTLPPVETRVEPAVAIEAPPLVQTDNQQKKKKKKAVKTTIAHIGLGLPTHPTTVDPALTVLEPHTASNPRKRRRTNDAADDAGTSSRPKPTAEPPSQSGASFSRTATPLSDDLSLTPGYNSDREPTIGDMDAYHGLDPATINPENRPPPFHFPPAQWDTSLNPQWEHPTVEEELFWGGRALARNEPALTMHAMPPQAPFGDPIINEYIRNTEYPDFSRVPQPHFGQNPSLGRSMAFPASLRTLLNDPLTATSAPAPPSVGDPQVYGAPPPPTNGLAARNRSDNQTPTPRNQGQKQDYPNGLEQPIAAPTPRRPDAYTPSTVGLNHARPSSRASVLSYVTARPAAPHQPEQDENTMDVDEEPRANPTDPPAPHSTLPSSRPGRPAPSRTVQQFRRHHRLPVNNATAGPSNIGPPSAGPSNAGPSNAAPPNLAPPGTAPVHFRFTNEEVRHTFGDPASVRYHRHEIPDPPIHAPQNERANEDDVEEEDEDDGQANLLYQEWMPAAVTPAPPGGWRAIQGESFYFKQDGQCQKQASKWLSSPRPGLLVSFAGHGARDNDPDSLDRIVRLQDTLKEEYNIPNPELYLPDADTADGQPPKDNEDPIYILLQGITTVQRRTLLRKKWHVTKDLQVRFVDLSLAPSTWMGSFEKKAAFGIMKAEQILPHFRAGFRREPLRSRTLEAINLDKAAGPRSKWGDLPALVALELTINSAYIRIMPRKTTGGASDPLIQLYCESPTYHPRDWYIWREAVREQPFSTENGAKAVLLRKTFKCKLCHSADHPVGLCDLPTVPGWNGPTTDEVASRGRPETSRNEGRAQRGRGGQRGRGNRGRGGRGQGRGQDTADRARTEGTPRITRRYNDDEGWAH